MPPPCCRWSTSPTARRLAREIYNGRMGIVPYIAPGFGLAKAAAAVFEQNPQVEGLILHKHGIFTFGEDAREAYERMIEMVSLAESRLRQGRPVVFQARQIDSAIGECRGDCANHSRRLRAIKHDGRRADALHYRFPHRPRESWPMSTGPSSPPTASAAW